MSHLSSRVAAALLCAVILSGCQGKPPAPTTPPPAATQKPNKAPELKEPIEKGLQALKTMNDAGRRKDIPAAEQAFAAFRTEWATIREKLKTEDPRLEVHINDGVTELDLEFKKAPNDIRPWELDEETVKLGRLLSTAADELGVPIRADLVQKDPTQNIPFNKEQRVEVTLVDHKIQPKLIELEQHTKVTFVVTNRGKETHEFELGHYAVGVEEVKPGETKELTLVVLDAGEFETACYIPGHYEVGMHGLLKVHPAELKKR